MPSSVDRDKELSNVRRRYSVALIGVALYLVLDIIAQLLPPHYSPISQAESDLAVGPYGFIMTVNFLNRGVLSLEFLFALLGTARIAGAHVSRMRTGKFLFGVWAIGALLLAFFPTDVPATPVSWHGAIHLIVAIVAFLGGAFGALALSLGLRGSPKLEAIRSFALPIAAISVVLCLVDLLLPGHLAAHYGGLFERLFLGSVLVWIAAISAYMLRSPPETAPPAVTSSRGP
jgi:hypothetical protein